MFAAKAACRIALLPVGRVSHGKPPEVACRIAVTAPPLCLIHAFEIMRAPEVGSTARVSGTALGCVPGKHKRPRIGIQSRQSQTPYPEVMCLVQLREEAAQDLT